MAKNINRYVFLIIPVVLLVMASCSGQRKTVEMKEMVFTEEKDESDSTALQESFKQEEPEYFSENFIRNEDYVYHQNLKSVQLRREGDDLSPPVIRFNSSDRLHLSFDDLDTDVKDYRFTLIHCDANWHNSDLFQNEYLPGFTEDYINDYKFSFNTIQTYTHYSLVLPTADLNFTIPGNYILRVYVSDESNIAFTLRFMVVDSRVGITGRVKRASAINDRNYRQEIDFQINTAAYPIAEPYRNLNVIILQNYRWDNAIMNLKPRLVAGDILDYNYDEENVFDGNNEFRNFDMKSLKYRSPEIKGITFEHNENHVYLWEDKVKTFSVYSYDRDINGRYYLSCEDVLDTDIECDYAYVHFLLPFPGPLTDGQLYIFGALTNWQLSKNSMMKYNPGKGGYTSTLMLKEGYYNYAYAFLPNNTAVADLTRIEGNHFDTENEYTILVYYRRPGMVYDELIGVETFDSLSGE